MYKNLEYKRRNRLTGSRAVRVKQFSSNIDALLEGRNERENQVYPI